MSRGAGFELRTRSMGITEEALVAQKVAIWEGMDVDKQSGTVSETVSKLELLIAFPFRGCMELLLIGGENLSSTMRGFSCIFCTNPYGPSYIPGVSTGSVPGILMIYPGQDVLAYYCLKNTLYYANKHRVESLTYSFLPSCS